MAWDKFKELGNNLPFELAVAAGQIANFSPLRKFGESVGVSTTERPLWDAGNQNYHYTDPASPEGYLISSSDNTDTQNIVTVRQDGNYDEIIGTFALTGTTPVPIGTSIRGYRMFNIGPGRTNILGGTLHMYGSGVVSAGVPSATTMIRAQIIPPHNQTLMAIYTVPRYTTFYCEKYSWSALRITGASAVAVECDLYTAGSGQPFRVQDAEGAANLGGVPAEEDMGYLEIPEKTDIELRVSASAAAAIAGGFKGYLVRETY